MDDKDKVEVKPLTRKALENNFQIKFSLGVYPGHGGIKFYLNQYKGNIKNVSE